MYYLAQRFFFYLLLRGVSNQKNLEATGFSRQLRKLTSADFSVPQRSSLVFLSKSCSPTRAVIFLIIIYAGISRLPAI